MILILCGPTASGKSTIQKLLCEKYGFHRVVTYTTREPRENEVFGEDYYFVTEDKFVDMIIKKVFIESTTYSNNRYYGTSISSIKDADKKDYVAVMTPSGARRMKKYATEHNIPCVVVLLDISLKTKVYLYVQRISDFKMEDLQELYGRCERDYGMFENFDKEVDMTLYNDDYYSQEEVAQTIMSQIEEKRAKNAYNPKEIKKVYIDLDNTVFDTLDTILYFYNKEFKYHEGFKEIGCSDVQTYDCKECNLLTKEHLKEYFDRSSFYEFTHINTIFWDVLALIVKKGWKPVFVTVGSIPNIAAKTAWFEDYIKEDDHASFIGLADAKDKSSIDMSDGIMIDDHPDMLNSSNAAVKICFGEYGWNKDWKGLRAKNWKEADKILGVLANER